MGPGEPVSPTEAYLMAQLCGHLGRSLENMRVRSFCIQMFSDAIHCHRNMTIVDTILVIVTVFSKKQSPLVNILSQNHDYVSEHCPK